MKMDPTLHREKKPDWIKVRLPNNPAFWSTKSLITDLKLVTVCEEAQCPNRWECWGQGTATFMIAGDKCTRACGFCAVKTAKPDALEADEPARVAEATRRMNLRHIVITAVARDDLRDGGAEHFKHTIEAVRQANPEIIIEVLVPDFNDRDWALAMVMEARPHIFNHNLETVERLTPLVRSRAQYQRSLTVLKKAKAMVNGKVATKSGIMLGLGERHEEILRAMDDLLEHDVTVLTMGQYLRPTPKHLPVVEYITPGCVRRIQGHRPGKRLPPRRQRSAGPQLLSCGGFPPGTRRARSHRGRRPRRPRAGTRTGASSLCPPLRPALSQAIA